MRERADAAGLSMSRYLVERALTAELPRDGDGKIGPPPRLVLSEGEQQQIHDRIERIYARMSTGVSDGAEVRIFDEVPRLIVVGGEWLFAQPWRWW